MKSQKIIITLCMILFTVAFLQAESFTVVFSDGTVKVKSGASWKSVNIGDSLSGSNTVKLESGSMLEIASNKSTLTLYDPGTYVLNELLNASQKVKSQKFLNAVDARIQNVVQGNDYHRTTAAGLRGFEQGERGSEFDEVEWAVEEDEAGGEVDPITQGQNLLALNKYDEAITHFEKMIAEWPYPEAKPFFTYYLAYAYAEKNQKAQALKLLDKITVNQGHILYADYVMLKGRLLLESFAYKSALQIFEQYLALNSQGENTQAVLLLASYCYKGLADTDRQKDCLLKAKEIDPDSLLGKEAGQLLKDM
ncbi:MAG: tetratricopeptide repeat protein [Spirochaetales bacterium]|nr:tetratricopeptide repeat protein [Spirochaetales bacterium]